jgi:hypothetical protein
MADNNSTIPTPGDPGYYDYIINKGKKNAIKKKPGLGLDVAKLKAKPPTAKVNTKRKMSASEQMLRKFEQTGKRVGEIDEGDNIISSSFKKIGKK